MSQAIDRPSPVPSPVGFVVTKVTTWLRQNLHHFGAGIYRVKPPHSPLRGPLRRPQQGGMVGRDARLGAAPRPLNSGLRDPLSIFTRHRQIPLPAAKSRSEECPDRTPGTRSSRSAKRKLYRATSDFHAAIRAYRSPQRLTFPRRHGYACRSPGDRARRAPVLAPSPTGCIRSLGSLTKSSALPV